MAAGTHYDLNPAYKPEEFYRVETGVRKSGPFLLETEGLVSGTILPVFTPVEADLEKRTVKVVKNVRVVEAYDNSSVTLKIAKGSLVAAGDILGSGKKGGEVVSVDKSGSDYDTVTLKAVFGEEIAKDAVLFEATAAGGTKKKNTANFVLFDEKKVEKGALCTLLMQAYEVKDHKLPLPIHDLDKEGLTSRFQFDY